ncbi:WbqC family protein [Constantimarinum furrinae]|uniref:WbqC-like protein n=1 Tax=Constantimarinum furrinae TaxID=2562285 RepID=A0A7G8PVN6_9FLAO|nr:WbqC family protein [Constantimarinum furrinae]QNJ98402.1 hypothetical protein ALE3EI_1854 [Constantimarinum furrinae]
MDTILLHPAYFPCIAQMAAVVHAESVVFEVEDNYQKQTYRNRCCIAHTQGVLQLNIPIKHSKSGKRQKMKDVLVENDFPWQSQHWKSLQTAYRTSPFFEFYEDDLEHLFSQKVTHLLDHNIAIYQVICEMIGIDDSFAKTDRFEKNKSTGDLRSLIVAKKEPDYGLTPYTQVFGDDHGFLSNMSILDLLFNEGPNTLHYLEEQDIKKIISLQE